MHSIGTAAKKSGVTIETIRYYEREGVVPEAARSASGRRIYAREGIARLRFVKRCRDLGFPIADIKSLLALSEGEETSCDDARIIGEENLALVREKIADLGRMETALVQLLGLCENGTSQCPMLKELFAGRPVRPV